MRNDWKHLWNLETEISNYSLPKGSSSKCLQGYCTAVLHNFSVQWREIMPDNHPDLSLPPAIPDTSPGCCHWCTQSHKRTAEKDRRTDPRKHEKNDEWCINKNLFVLISFYLVLSIKKYSLKGKKIYFIFIQQIKFMCIVHKS